jgi:hypothetical protein
MPGEKITVEAQSNGDITFQWYECENESKRGAVKVSGANTAALTIPDEAESGVHYYFVRVTVDGLASTDSAVFTVNIN